MFALRRLTLLDPVPDHTSHTAESEVAFLRRAHSWAHVLEQGIGRNSTMDWHKEVRKDQRMFMAVENMAHANMSII